jgi:hypothetical protein
VWARNITDGTKEFFLVRGELNVTYAKGYAQPAVGIEEWHAEYMELPAFQKVERVWVVITNTEDNARFVLSLARDIAIREKCLISTEGVQSVCKLRLQLDRAHNVSYFESLFHFQPIPLPSHADKLTALTWRKPIPEPATPTIEDPNYWMWQH